MKFRLGHFTSLQILFGFGTIVHFKTWPLKSCTDKHDHWDDASEFFKSSRLEFKSNHPCLSQLASPPRSFKYGWQLYYWFVLSWLGPLVFQDMNTIEFVFKLWQPPHFWNYIFCSRLGIPSFEMFHFFQLHSQVLTIIVLFKTWLSKSWILFGF